MIFLLYTGTSALIIYIFNIQGTKKYSAVMYYLHTDLEFVKKIYTTQFSAERILHTENA